MVWRRLRPGEIDHEALWLGVSLATLGVVWAWLRLGLPRPICFFHALTGWPCPGCGATRSVTCALDGSFEAAFRMNPLFSLALAGIVVFDVYAVVVLATRLPRLRFEQDSLSLPLRIAAIAAVLLNWVWLIHAGV